MYFSYQTMVAFIAPGVGLVVHDNDWGPTAGKHLNWIDGGNKADRVCGEEFDRLWKLYGEVDMESDEIASLITVRNEIRAKKALAGESDSVSPVELGREVAIRNG